MGNLKKGDQVVIKGGTGQIFIVKNDSAFVHESFTAHYITLDGVPGILNSLDCRKHHPMKESIIFALKGLFWAIITSAAVGQFIALALSSTSLWKYLS